jgi:hypothetical protein
VGVRDVNRFGGRTGVLGDINGDGWADLMHQVGANSNPKGCNSEYNQLWILSGKDGSTRTSASPRQPVA